MIEVDSEGKRHYRLIVETVRCANNKPIRKLPFRKETLVSKCALAWFAMVDRITGTFGSKAR